jgi:tetratricopeptide (TPR) repeat protein
MDRRMSCASLRILVLVLTVASMPLGQAVSEQTANAGDPLPQEAPSPVPAAQGDIGPETGRSELWLQQAKALMRQKKFDEAEASIHRYLSAVPLSAEGHVILGFILFQKDQPNDSLHALAEVKKAGVPNAFAFKIIGLDYAMLKQYLQADEWLTKALHLEPKDSAGWQWLGDIRLLESHNDGALACYQKSVEIDPENTSSQNAVGTLYESMGRHDEALAAYRRAVTSQSAVGPIDPIPFYNLGRLLLEQNDAQDALPYLIQAVKTDPDSAEAHEQLAKAYASLNRATEAEGEFNVAITINPDKAALHFQLGQVYKRQGESEKAEKEFDRFKALSVPGRAALK